MQFIFKTNYEDDIHLFPHRGYFWSYGTLLAAAGDRTIVLSSYLQSQLVFVCIYAIVGVALMILTGFTGQASLGHAAFLAIGAYTAAYLQIQRAVPGLFPRCRTSSPVSSAPWSASRRCGCTASTW